MESIKLDIQMFTEGDDNPDYTGIDITVEYLDVIDVPQTTIKINFTGGNSQNITINTPSEYIENWWTDMYYEIESIELVNMPNFVCEYDITPQAGNNYQIQIKISLKTATYFNGVELTDIYYNNGKLLEMYYNGTLVFKKPTIYKRRIMVDDNLKDKTIFINPVTDNVYQFLRDYIDNNPDTFYLSIITVENEALDPSYQKGGYCAILTYDTTGIEVNYEFYNGLLHPVNFLGGDNENNMIVNTNVEIPFNDNLSVVSDINDVNPVYRWLYIEDSNIRPIQVGDKIIEGTKFYGVVPDNANPVNGTIAFYDDINSPNIPVGYFYISADGSAELWLGKISVQYIYRTSPPQYGGLYENNSVIISETEYTITRIDGNNLLLNYVLVDTTTLGQ